MLFSRKIGSCIYLFPPKGGITSELLNKILERMDGFNIFPCVPSGPLPFLLLEGHGSRLQLPFLRYTNHPDHPCIVCLGLPNGTALWQIGDDAKHLWLLEDVHHKVQMGSSII